ncbi:MAG: homoserine O-acetyltransferase, partial [Bacteroidota bacterium]
YWTLSKAMDAHQVGRERGGVEQALQRIKAKTLVIGIGSDVLFPITEQQYLATSIPEACYEEISSLYGHDGFLIENDKIRAIVQQWQQEKALLV